MYSSEYYLNETSQKLNNPVKFWKTIESLSPSTSSNDFPSQILVNDSFITNRTEIVNSFNKHVISSGSIFNEISDCNIQNSPLSMREDALPLVFLQSQEMRFQRP